MFANIHLTKINCETKFSDIVLMNCNASASNPAATVLGRHENAQVLSVNKPFPQMVYPTQMVNCQRLKIDPLKFSNKSYRCNYVKVKKIHGLLVLVATRKENP